MPLFGNEPKYRIFRIAKRKSMPDGLWTKCPECGEIIFNKKLEVDKEKLRGIVFSNKLKLKKLEIIVWPYIEKEREKRTKDKEGIIIIEAAMLYESGLDKKFDKNILVSVDEELRIKRLMKRKNISKEEALKRIILQIKDRWRYKNGTK